MADVLVPMTLSDLWPGFQGHDIFWSRISEKRRNLSNGTRFADLDWPLNASRGFLSAWTSCPSTPGRILSTDYALRSEFWNYLVIGLCNSFNFFSYYTTLQVKLFLHNFYRAMLWVLHVSGLCSQPVSIRLSVRLSRSCTVFRWLKIPSNFFLRPV